MQILITGFQRSGTTMLRRILNAHPHIRVMFHEQFLLRQYNSKKGVLKFLKAKKIHPYDENWGEKCPFYPAIRQVPVIDYCRRWNEYFGKTSRILHIVRHPVDVALSVQAKAASKGKKVKGGFEKPYEMFREWMRYYVPKINNMKNTFSFKYEDLLMDPDTLLPLIFEYLHIDKDIDFRAAMSRIKQERYRIIDSSRAFAYRNGPPIKIKTDMRSTLNVINRTIGGVEYTI